MIRKLAHLCFVTDNLETMLEFYSVKLGLPIKFTFTNSDGEIFGHYLECGDTSFIEIFDRVLKQKQWGGTIDTEKRRGSFYDHFCLEVTGMKEFKALLESRGIVLTDIATGMDHSFQMWTKDPDGNPIEFMEYTAASRQLQPRKA